MPDMWLKVSHANLIGDTRDDTVKQNYDIEMKNKHNETQNDHKEMKNKHKQTQKRP